MVAALGGYWAEVLAAAGAAVAGFPEALAECLAEVTAAVAVEVPAAAAVAGFPEPAARPAAAVGVAEVVQAAAVAGPVAECAAEVPRAAAVALARPAARSVPATVVLA